MSKARKPKHLFSIIYMAVTIVAIVLVALFATDLEAIGEALKGFNIWWLFACIGALLLYWLTDALLLHDITRYMYAPQPFSRSLKVGMIGLYYCALTPSSTGGQPMQVIYMKRDGIPVGASTCIVGIKFVVFELSLCALYIAGMIVRGPYFYVHNNQAFWLSVLGFVVNLIAVCCIILTIVNKKFVLNAGKGILKFLGRIRLVRHVDTRMASYEHTIEDYHTAASYISKHRLHAFGSFIISVFNLGFMFMIPYFIYLSFGYTKYSLFDIFIMESFLFLAVSFFPLPGAAGASEGGFLLFFGQFFMAATAVAMLIWRFLTYYMILIVGSLIVLFGEVWAMRRSKRKAQTESEEP